MKCLGQLLPYSNHSNCSSHSNSVAGVIAAVEIPMVTVAATILVVAIPALAGAVLVEAIVIVETEVIQSR